MYWLRIIFFLLCTAAGIHVNAQIVNVESRRIQTDTTGWAGSFGGSMNITKNVDRVFSANTFAHLQYKNKKSLYLLLGDYTFLKGNQKKYSDNIFLHLRYNRKIVDFLRWELFSQLQSNKITKIDTRFLTGMGPRFKISGTGLLHVYLGLLTMYEYEKELTTPPGFHYNIRGSNYLSFTIKPTATLEIISTTFYQPLYSNWKDFRILNQESVSLTITNNLSATINWDYLDDKFPVEGVPQRTYAFSTGLKYAF